MPSLQVTPSGSTIEFYLGDPGAPGGGVYDADTDAAIAAAAVTLAITEANGAAIAGLGGVAMPAVAGAAGDYRCTVAANAGLVTGRRYRAAATVAYGGQQLVVHAEFAMQDYYGEAA